MKCPDTVRQNIINAAKERFLHYGYGKTTIAELARDCSMSPGNLYRYFQGKLDIAEEIARESSDANLAVLREVVRKTGQSASEKLRTYLETALKTTYDMLEEDPRVFEIATTISQERPSFANEQMAKERALMAEVLSAGNADGEFNIPDVVDAAEMIQCATMKFRYPQLWSNLPFNELMRELRGVTDLILRGVQCPHSRVTNVA